MKKKVLILSLTIGLGLNIIGCTHDHKVKANVSKQFQEISYEIFKGHGGCNSTITIIKHKKTGKRFILYQGNNGRGICPLD